MTSTKQHSLPALPMDCGRGRLTFKCVSNVGPIKCNWKVAYPCQIDGLA